MSRVKDGILLGAIQIDPAAVALKDGKNSSRIQVAKTGQKFKWRGRTFDFTEANFDKMVENFEKTTTKPPVDYNHLSMNAVVPEQAIAAGWFQSLERIDQKLFGDVEWTPKAAAHIEAKEYRYVSPTITPEGVDEQGNSIGHLLLSAAITNYPFLKDMEPVSLSELQNSGLLLADFSFDEKRSRLSQAVTDKFVNSFSYVSLVDYFDDHVVIRKDGKLWRLEYSISSKGDVKFKSEPVETVAQYVALSANPPVRTPMEDFKNHPDYVALSNQVATLATTVDTLKTANQQAATEVAEERKKREALELELKTNKANTAVLTLIRAGKVAPASKEKMVALYLNDPKFFEEFAATLPVILKVDGTAQGDNGDAGEKPSTDKDPVALMTAAIEKHITDNGGPSKMSYGEAMRAVTLQNPELAEEYRFAFSGQSSESGAIN